MRMRLGVGLALLAAATMIAAPAGAQVLTNSLPAGFTLADYAALTYSAPQVVVGVDAFNAPKFTANVSWDMVTKGPDTYYWYKVEAVSFATPGDAINRVTVNMDTSLVNTIGPVLQFGQYDPAGPTTALVANGATSTPLKLSWDSTPGGHRIHAGEYAELWVVSNAPGFTPNSLQMIDGGVGTAVVPVPAPEPMSMALAGLGLAAVGGLRKRAQKG